MALLGGVTLAFCFLHNRFEYFFDLCVGLKVSQLGVGWTKEHNESQLAVQSKSPFFFFVFLCIKNDAVDVGKKKDFVL